MRRVWTLAAIAIAAALALAPFHRVSAAGAGPFDGTWNVEADRPSAGNVEGYDWRFPAQVSAGALTGSRPSPTNSARGRPSRRIHPDGGAVVTMVGRTALSRSRSAACEPRSTVRPRPISLAAADRANETNSALAR